METTYLVLVLSAERWLEYCQQNFPQNIDSSRRLIAVIPESSGSWLRQSQNSRPVSLEHHCGTMIFLAADFHLPDILMLRHVFRVHKYWLVSL